jgi:hypothetical protein
MHELLTDCMPEGIFLECTLVRLDDEGRATVSPAGGSRLLVGKKRRPPDLVKLRGAWLGVRAPTADEQHRLELGHGDELILATDGVFDQLDDHGGTAFLANGAPEDRGLFETLRESLERCLQCSPQKDDITLVLLRRREPADHERDARRPRGGPASGCCGVLRRDTGVDDVPV